MRKFMEFSLAVVVVMTSLSCRAQVATGQYPFGTFDNKGFETINVGNLNVHFAIPILNKTGRGIPFTYALSYDSSVWQPVNVNGSMVWQPVPNFGWQAQTVPILGYISYHATSKTMKCLLNGTWEYWTLTTYTRWSYTDKFGSVHGFSLILTAGNPPDECSAPVFNSSGSAISPDGSGYTISATVDASSGYASITTASGQQIDAPMQSPNGAGTATDSNGNQITVNAGQFIDTTGKTALTVSGGAPNPLAMTYSDTSGNPQAVTVTYKTYTVQTAFGCSGIGEYGPTSTSLVDSILFPDGSSYHFAYEQTPGIPNSYTGRISRVTTPQGGVITYAYSGGENGIECADGSTAGLARSISADSGSAASNWTYSRTTGTGTSETVVTDGLTNQSTYDFVLASNGTSGAAAYYETSRKN